MENAQRQISELQEINKALKASLTNSARDVEIVKKKNEEWRQDGMQRNKREAALKNQINSQLGELEELKDLRALVLELERKLRKAQMENDTLIQEQCVFKGEIQRLNEMNSRSMRLSLIDKTPCANDLQRQLDEANRELCHEKDKNQKALESLEKQWSEKYNLLMHDYNESVMRKNAIISDLTLMFNKKQMDLNATQLLLATVQSSLKKTTDFITEINEEAQGALCMLCMQNLASCGSCGGGCDAKGYKMFCSECFQTACDTNGGVHVCRCNREATVCMDELRHARYTQEGQRVTERQKLAEELFGPSEEEEESGEEEEEHSVVGESEEEIDEHGENGLC